ncbi:hypothetical protein [Alteromonas oceanisediminis]|uniref:hypothetical protein n=1 Tax=Alteromonas oceanisediminis TaxID=2836180 RepID=UPI001BD9BA21|nr:hypothetical protein [Alteromonas oceanisediminis]MBT0587717.1 hypothetical protein [Alteromonas oceanisediminis]
MGLLIEKLPFYRELILLYSLFSLLAVGGFCFFYFLVTAQKPDFWMGFFICNMVWILAMRSAVKHSYLRGASDTLKDMPYNRDGIK